MTTANQLTELKETYCLERSSKQLEKKQTPKQFVLNPIFVAALYIFKMAS